MRDSRFIYGFQKSPLSRETEEATWPKPRNLGRGGLKCGGNSRLDARFFVFVGDSAGGENAARVVVCVGAHSFFLVLLAKRNFNFLRRPAKPL